MSEPGLVEAAIGGDGRCPRDSEGAAPPPGVFSSNTPPPTSNCGANTGGEDWFEWCLYVDWRPVWDTLQPRLATAKEIAGDRQMAKETGGDLFFFGGREARAYPSGSALGKKGKGLFMAYRLEAEGLIFQIANKPLASGNAPNVVIRADGMQCLIRGAPACLEKGRDIIKKVGGEILKEKLTRVDMCLDMPEVGMGEFVSAYHERRYVCRANVRGLYESTGITISLGKHPLMLRIYDKAAQIRHERDATKQFFMAYRRWNNKTPDVATRVELELGREALKERGIDTPEDYFAARGDLARYLLTEWVRFTAEPVDRTNTSRAAVLPLWEAVKAGFWAWTGEPLGKALVPLDRGKIDVSRLVKQALGVLITAAAAQGRKNMSREAFMLFLIRQLSEVLGTVQINDELRRRLA